MSDTDRVSILFGSKESGETNEQLHETSRYLKSGTTEEYTDTGTESLYTDGTGGSSNRNEKGFRRDREEVERVASSLTTNRLGKENPSFLAVFVYHFSIQ